jgi:hypothetical protein
LFCLKKMVGEKMLSGSAENNHQPSFGAPWPKGWGVFLTSAVWLSVSVGFRIVSREGGSAAAAKAGADDSWYSPM